MFLIGSIRTGKCVFAADCYLCADTHREEYGWQWEHIILLPPANRMVLDSLFNVVFMLEDLEARSVWYHKSGWREQKMEYERFLSEYGNDPEWAEWLPRCAQFIETGRKLFQITDAEAADPAGKIKPWPNPGKMANYRVGPAGRPPDRQFLHYLNDWFYRDHSALSHMSFSGEVKLGGILFRRELGDQQQQKLNEELLPRLMSSQACRAAILLLCLISEVEHYFKFGGDVPLRVLDLWHIFMPDFPEAKELFEKRYSSFWPAPLINAHKAAG